MKQYKLNIRLTILFGILFGMLLGGMLIYKVEINTLNQALDSLHNCYEKYALKENPYEIKCFQRILRHDRFLDVENNIILHSSFYNTTWHETECEKYDDYELMEGQN